MTTNSSTITIYSSVIVGDKYYFKVVPMNMVDNGDDYLNYSGQCKAKGVKYAGRIPQVFFSFFFISFDLRLMLYQ